MIVYVFVYLLFFSLSIIEVIGKIRNKKIFIFLSFSILLLLSTIRTGRAGDNETYMIFFEQTLVRNNFFVAQNFQYEVLFDLFMWICKFFTNDYKFYLFCVALFVVGLEYIFTSRLSKNEFLNNYFFTIIFIFWCLYYCNIFVIRSTIASMICLFSIPFIKKRKFWSFLICILIAFGFHNSALIFLPAYFFFKRKTTNVTLKTILYFGISIILLLFLEPLLNLSADIIGGTIGSKIHGYLNGNSSEGIGDSTSYSITFLIFKAIINIGFLIFLCLYNFKHYRDDEQYIGYFNLYLIGSALYISTLKIGYAFARLSIYYNVFQIPLMIYFINRYGQKKGRISVYLLIVAYVSFRYVINLIGSNYIDAF